MDAVTRLAPTVGIVAACDLLAVARASFYRQRPVLGPSVSPAPEPALPLERVTLRSLLTGLDQAYRLRKLYLFFSICSPTLPVPVLLAGLWRSDMKTAMEI